MKRTIVFLIFAAAGIAQPPGIRAGAASPGTVNLGSNPITETWTVGTGGVTANKLVQTDSSAPLKIVDSTTGVYGVAMATVSAAGTVEVARYGTVPCVTDTGGSTAGNLVIIGTGTTDTCKDSGQTSSSSIPITTRIIGVFRSTATAGNTALVELTPSHFGTQVTGGSGTGTQYSFSFKVTGSGSGILTPPNPPTLEIVGNNANLIQATLPASCTFKNLYVGLGNGATVASTKSVTFQLFTIGTVGSNPLGGTATSIQCTIAAGQSSCSDTSHTVAATAPLSWGLQVSSTDTNSLYGAAGLQCQ